MRRSIVQTLRWHKVFSKVVQTLTTCRPSSSTTIGIISRRQMRGSTTRGQRKRRGGLLRYPLTQICLWELLPWVETAKLAHLVPTELLSLSIYYSTATIKQLKRTQRHIHKRHITILHSWLKDSPMQLQQARYKRICQVKESGNRPLRCLTIEIINSVNQTPIV